MKHPLMYIGLDFGYYEKTLKIYGYENLFIPDTSSIITDANIDNAYTKGTYSDAVYLPSSNYPHSVVAFGGSLDSGNEAGLYTYNFNLKKDTGYNHVSSRLCFYTKKI